MFLKSICNKSARVQENACGNCVFRYVLCLFYLITDCKSNYEGGFDILSPHLFEVTKDNHDIRQPGSLSLGPHLNPETLENEAEILSTGRDNLCSGMGWPPCHNTHMKFDENRSVG